jgi:hypothetical protein
MLGLLLDCKLVNPSVDFVVHLIHSSHLVSWEKMAISLTDAMIVNSITTASRLRSAYPHKAKQIFSVQNAVIEEFLDRCAARKYFADCFKLDPQKKMVGSMGRLDPKKAFRLLATCNSKDQG